MPKIPTFEARGSIEQLSGTTSNILQNTTNEDAQSLIRSSFSLRDYRI